jgi:hypothetical protein
MGNGNHRAGIWKVAVDQWSTPVDTTSTSYVEGQQSGEVSIQWDHAGRARMSSHDLEDYTALDVGVASAQVVVGQLGVVPLHVIRDGDSKDDIVTETAKTPVANDSLRPVVSMPATIPPARGRPPLVSSASIVVVAISLVVTAVSAGMLAARASGVAVVTETSHTPVTVVTPHLAPRR